MDNVFKISLWIFIISYLSGNKIEFFRVCQVRSFFAEVVIISSQNKDRNVQFEGAIAPQQTFQQPHSKEARASSDKQPFATYLFEARRSMLENEIEVCG